MKSYSQSGEDKKVMEFFGDFKGTCLSLGENQGTFLSNALLLIENGWCAVLVEPDKKVFEKLQNLHSGNEKVTCLNVAIGDINGKVKFYSSGTHLGIGDLSLLSTASIPDKQKWELSTVFTETEVDMITFDKLLQLSPYKTFDYITSDCEGNDVIALRQMDLAKLGCKLLCIEHNGHKENMQEIKRLCDWYGLTTELLLNAENVIYAK